MRARPQGGCPGAASLGWVCVTPGDTLTLGGPAPLLRACPHISLRAAVSEARPACACPPGWREETTLPHRYHSCFPCKSSETPFHLAFDLLSHPSWGFPLCPLLRLQMGPLLEAAA